MGQSYPQQGVGSYDREHDQFLRHDGSIPLTTLWGADDVIRLTRLFVTSGGNINIGEVLNGLRITHEGAEVIKITGESNAEAELLQKNATMTDLSGVGVRAVLADVNGKLSAP